MKKCICKTCQVNIRKDAIDPISLVNITIILVRVLTNTKYNSCGVQFPRRLQSDRWQTVKQEHLKIVMHRGTGETAIDGARLGSARCGWAWLGSAWTGTAWRGKEITGGKIEWHYRKNQTHG